MTNGKHSDSRKEQYWCRQVQHWQKSAQSIREFCRQHGLPEATFYYWQRRLTPPQPARASTSPAVTFLPLEVNPPVAKPTAVLEVVLRKGCLVRVPAGFDQDTLRTVLSLLEEDLC